MSMQLLSLSGVLEENQIVRREGSGLLMLQAEVRVETEVRSLGYSSVRAEDAGN